MLGFQFAPRIADLADRRLYVPGRLGDWPNLAPLIGGALNIELMEQQFDEVMRLTTSIKQGTVTAVNALRERSTVDDVLLGHLAPASRSGSIDARVVKALLTLQ
jgi:TnpA family transposase